MINILYLHAGAELYGADKVLLELVSGLNKIEFNPIVILPNDGVLVEKLKERNITVKVIDYPILRRKYFNIRGLVYYISNYFKSVKLLKKIVKDEKIDIIHVNTFAVLQGIYLKLSTKAKYVWHIHEIIKSPAFLSKILSTLSAIFADETIVVSEAVKEHLIRDANFKNIKVIYNGVDNKIYNSNNDVNYLKKEFNLQENTKVIGMIGRVNSWKGQDDFLDSVIPILEQDSSVVAFLVGGVFAGEEYRMENLRKRIGNVSVKNQIYLIDFRSDPQNIHNLFDVFVLPSINPDPLPTVVLEAMATGKPVVGYNHGGICEMVKNNFNGILVETRDTTSLKNALIKVLYTPNLREMFSINSVSRQKEMFSLESYIKNFSTLYSYLVHE